MKHVLCPVCGGKCVKFGRNKSGTQRWLCRKCSLTFVMLCAAAGFITGYFIMIKVFAVFMLQMDGYFAFYLKPSSMVLSILYLLIGYALVSAVDYIRIKKIPMDIALKNLD